MKRKQPVQVNLAEDMDDAEDDDVQVPPTKRRRCTTGLENGLAHMSLGNGGAARGPYPSRQAAATATPPQASGLYPVGIVEEQEQQESTTSPGSVSEEAPQFTYVPGDRRDVVLPGSIEEPSSAPEIKMGSSSWYEPERDRIVITDLEGYAADSEGEDEGSRREDESGGLTVEDMDSPTDVNINPAFLDRIRKTRTALDHPHRNAMIPLPHLPDDQSRALVLFKPLPFLKPEGLKPQTDSEAPTGPTLAAPEDDDDAMDLDG